jgi:hypothetical protein
MAILRDGVEAVHLIFEQYAAQTFREGSEKRLYLRRSNQ